MTRYAVALGSNQGDRLDNLIAAVESLRSWTTVTAVSSLYETEPVGGPEQDPFLNAVVMIDTQMTPLQVLDRLKTIENDLGRVRSVKWGPRTIDLDLVSSDGPEHHDERLHLPHSLAAQRGFVLMPLVDVWPDAPVAPGIPAREALSDLDTSGVDLLSADWVPPISKTPSRLFVMVQFLGFLVAAVALAADGSLPGGEVTFSNVAGAAIAMTGLFLAFVASRRLGPAATPSPVPKKGSTLVISGPYRYARHPIYGGIFLVILGTALFLNSVYGVVAALALVVLFWIKAGFEERQLRMRFAGYSRYRDVVQRRFVPFVF